MKQLESKSAIATIHPNGIIEFRIKPNWDQPDTPEIAIDNALTLKEAVGNNICGLITYAPNLYLKKEVLEAYASVHIGHVASAIVVRSVGSRIFANLALKFIKTTNPKKIFTNPDKAKIWLLDQIANAKMRVGSR
jgi:hypothetical protein